MKIVEREFKREIAASAAAVLWNYWDHEHLYVVHKNYLNAFVVYEDQRMAVYLLTFRLPIFYFFTSESLNIQVQVDPETIKVFNMGLFGVPSYITITVKEEKKDFCLLTMNYKFILRGWRTILAPFLPAMMAKWNQMVWNEDYPVKMRRHRVMRLGFKDFTGLPHKIEDRYFDGKMDLELPVKRHKKSPINLEL